MSAASRLLCCIDGSAHSVRAAELACTLSPALGCGLTFLFVNQLRPASGFPPIRARTREEADEIVASATRYARLHGVRDLDSDMIEATDIAASIIDYARAHDIGHIVLGTGNPPFIGRLLIGSVSEAVVSGAHCTVTVAR